MIIKYEIILIASIAETLKVIYTNKNISFEKGINRMVNNHLITPVVEAELIWLWKIRDYIHLAEIQSQEFKRYEDTHFDRAVIAVRDFLNELNKNYH